MEEPTATWCVTSSAAGAKYLMMGDTKHEDDAGLLARVAGGDDRAFETFYRRYQSPVVGFFLRRTGDRELAFDLTAETFATVVVMADRFDPARGPGVGWLFGIASNKLKESLRRGRVESSARQRLGIPQVCVTDEDLLRVDELASIGDESRIAELMSELPVEQRTAILARVLDEQPYSQIAMQLKCSEAVARQRVSRGLKALRIRMEAAR